MVGIARQTQYQMPHAIRFAVAYNDTGISSGVVKGTLPAGAQILDIVVNVTAAFNAGTTNVLTLGSTSTATQYIAAGDLDETATGAVRIAPTAAWGSASKPSTDTDVYVKYAQTGTAGTAGAATFVLTYMPNNDL
jgi:hypothetical protein